ncbi:hypothetical protein [Dongia deserti]|uniref:hypothetical protein n=1 Tax=Dongia deserti TaxID=2268030 RepID=UPI000E652E4A|nr:hypothetical protein [Dongia deserti]
MPLQNRVNPFGELVATAARGTMMGNRGGKFHRDDRTLGKRRWASRHWICCDIHYKGNQHEAMGDGYTSLFFLDEVTALSAGHRPCFFCRRQEALQFLSLAEPPLMADAADRILHDERRASRRDAVAQKHIVADLPDSAMIAIDGAAYAVRGQRLLRWSFDGYTEALPRSAVRQADLITPPLFLIILARGYRPRWHASAG